MIQQIKIVVILFLISIQCIAQEKPGKNYFYTGKKYGSEAMFNPWNHFLNESADVFQIKMNNRDIKNIFKTDYSLSVNTVFSNLSAPVKNLKRYGFKDFLHHEVLFSLKEPYWVPNYSLHLLGGGVSYAMMKEWYEQHSFDHSGLYAFLTVMAGHLGNEIVEVYTNGAPGPNADIISDIYLFDIGGIILFSFEPIKKFFGEKVILTDWSYQPSLVFPEYGLKNVGKYFCAKIKIPRSSHFSIFSHFGLGMVFGLSYKNVKENSFSVGAGIKMDEIDWHNGFNYITRFRIGFYYDRKNSLLTSLIINNSERNFCNLNIYPGVIKIGEFSPGIWASTTKKGDISFGITSRFSIGLGFN